MKTRKKTVALLLTLCMIFALAACSTGKPADVSSEEATEQEVTDQEAADKVAALIDAIYVQTRTENTDAQCTEAKAAWDALTDAQKELVEGEEADPDYFGRDTGDASKDDPRNADDIGKNEILVVSFGTSFNDSRAKDIKGVEDAVQAAFPDWSVRRAFTAQIIINHIQARDGEKIDNMEQALDRAVNNGVENLVILPTHLMHGAEYDELTEAVENYGDKFESVVIAEPLLGPVGASITEINFDKQQVAQLVADAALAEAGYESMAGASEDGTAFVFMGHGTWHNAKISYTQMQTQMQALGYDNVFIGTVEGEPEETACENIIQAAKDAGFKKVILRPLMVVAGDHANNDMAGDDEDSWKSMFEASEAFESVETQISGLGRIAGIKELYVAHLADCIQTPAVPDNTETAPLPDGMYSAKFDTDSSMFHVNETKEGRGVLTVENGKMSIHISLPSQNILNLYPGSAEDAKKPGAELLMPTTDTVLYPDGSEETVNGFDIPVPYLDKSFDCALVGKKGVWNDHKVSVSDVQEILPDDIAGEPAIDRGGETTVEVTLSGGSGRAGVESPCRIEKDETGQYWAVIVWSSKYYEFMLVDGNQYDPIRNEGNSTFRIPVRFDEDMPVSAQTVAMSEPHMVEYTLRFDSSSIK